MGFKVIAWLSNRLTTPSNPAKLKLLTEVRTKKTKTMICLDGGSPGISHVQTELPYLDI